MNNDKEASIGPDLLKDIWAVDSWSRTAVVGKDWALQNDILESRERTQARSCYRECLTCGCCANSIRDGSSCSAQYDANVDKMVSCSGCEKFRFCDCRNGWFRNARGDAEPFTPEVIKLMKETGGKPHLGVAL